MIFDFLNDVMIWACDDLLMWLILTTIGPKLYGSLSNGYYIRYPEPSPEGAKYHKPRVSRQGRRSPG